MAMGHRGAEQALQLGVVVVAQKIGAARTQGVGMGIEKGP